MKNLYYLTACSPKHKAMASFFSKIGDSSLKNPLPLKYKTNLKAFNSLLNTKREHANRDKTEVQMFRSIGLVISLAMVIMAFQWKFYDDQSMVNLGGLNTDNFEDIIDVPMTEQPPPPPPAQKVVNILEVDDEEIIDEIDVDFDLEVSEETTVADVLYEVDLSDVEEEEADEIFTIVEQQPHPKGGMQAFYKFVSSELKYPSQARRMAVEGKVFVQFVIDKQGNITNAAVLKGIGAGCDEEAVRVLNLAPKWVPGKQRGKSVKVRMIIPIHFMLQ